MRLLMMTISLGAFLGAPAFGMEPYVGTWSKDRLNCHAAAERAALSVPDFGCERATFRKTANGWVVKASQCYGSDPSLEEPFSRAVHIVTVGATLRFSWPGFDSGPLVRC
jgi:hypothetical protein